MRHRTAARVDITVQNNASWIDAFQFGSADDTSWSFAGQSFEMDVKGNKYDASALFQLRTDNGRILVDDEVLRVLHFNCVDTEVREALAVGEYVYDLIMIDDATGVRVPLQGGSVRVVQGVTGDD